MDNEYESSSSSSSSSHDDTSSVGSYELDEAITELFCSTFNYLLQAEYPNVRQTPKRRTIIDRNREEANQRLMRDYFDEQPIYNDRIFRRLFQMSKRLFLKITSDLEQEHRYFQQRRDARGKLGFTAIQKCTSAICQMAYSVMSDLFDEYLALSDRTSRETLAMFCKGIIEIYGSAFLRRPAWTDLQHMYDVHEQVHGFPGMIGSIDCMPWPWELCPLAWRGTHTREDVGRPSLILQAVADLWIWNAYFGEQGSHNDINVFESSPILEEIVSGLAPTTSFYANGNYYKAGYYLYDGIYPEYATFVKTFTDPIDEKRKYFKKKQEATRNDIERAFGVLKKRWRIISVPARYWYKNKLQDCMYACNILHNMILQDEDKAICQDYDETDAILEAEYWTQQTPMETRIENLYMVKSRETHMLMADLVDHVWANHVPNENEDAPANIDDYVSDDE